MAGAGAHSEAQQQHTTPSSQRSSTSRAVEEGETSACDRPARQDTAQGQQQEQQVQQYQAAACSCSGCGGGAASAQDARCPLHRPLKRVRRSQAGAGEECSMAPAVGTAAASMAGGAGGPGVMPPAADVEAAPSGHAFVQVRVLSQPHQQRQHACSPGGDCAASVCSEAGLEATANVGGCAGVIFARATAGKAAQAFMVLDRAGSASSISQASMYA
jgi:hypothetical protein